jgi:hypothetical protein
MNIDPVAQAAANERVALLAACDRSARAAILRAFADNAGPMNMATACYLGKVELCYLPLFAGRGEVREESARRVFRSMCEDRTLGHVGWSAGGDYAYRPASDAVWSSRITGQIEGQC